MNFNQITVFCFHLGHRIWCTKPKHAEHLGRCPEKSTILTTSSVYFYLIPFTSSFYCHYILSTWIQVVCKRFQIKQTQYSWLTMCFTSWGLHASKTQTISPSVSLGKANTLSATALYLTFASTRPPATEYAYVLIYCIRLKKKQLSHCNQFVSKLIKNVIYKKRWNCIVKFA